MSVEPRPEMTDKQCRESVNRLHDRLDTVQAHDKYALINAQQIRDLLDPGGMWSYSFTARDSVTGDSTDTGG